MIAGRLTIALGWMILGAATAQSPQEYRIRVNGILVSSIRPATRISGEWYVPIAPVARALGADLKIDGGGLALRVLRSDGVAASYDGPTGRILQGSLIVGTVKNYRLVQLNTGLDNLIFPLDGLIALLGVTAQENQDEGILEISSLPPSSSGTPGGRQFHLASLNETYSFFTNGPAWQQALNLRGMALAGSDNVSANLDLIRTVDGPLFGFRQGMVRLETATHQVITAGDQGTSGDIEALSNTVRGLGYEWRWKQYVLGTYAGIAASSVSSSIGTAGLANYDTKIAGLRVHGKYAQTDLAIGANIFQGDRRRGVTFGLGYSGTYARNQFRLQGLVGSFSGFSLRPSLQLINPTLVTQTGPIDALPGTLSGPGTVVEVNQETARVKGAATGLSVLDSFSPFKKALLVITALWEQYSKNFLVVRDESQYSAVSRKSLSAGVRPSRFLGFTGSVHRGKALLGDSNLDRGYSYGVNAITPGRVPIQVGYFHSVQTLGVRFAMNQYTVQAPRLGRFSASGIYSEFKFGDLLTRSATGMVTAEFKRLGRIGVHDQVQLGESHNYGADWTKEFAKSGISFTGGLERQTTLLQRPILAPVAALRVPLPRGQHLSVSYFSVRGSQLLRFEIGGPLFRPREIVTAVTQTAMIVPVSVSGQVYQDVNLDEKYKAGIDRPLARLQVWLDGKDSTTTDAEGYFRFDGISPGAHTLRVGIGDLPADLVLLREDVAVALMPYASNRQDFRAVRVGRMQGAVRIASINEVGETVQSPFPDVRITATGNRESFSEREGDFAFLDLPPGTYEVRVDPASIPPGYVPSPEKRSVQVKSGQVAADVDFVLARPVIVRPVQPSRK